MRSNKAYEDESYVYDSMNNWFLAPLILFSLFSLNQTIGLRKYCIWDNSVLDQSPQKKKKKLVHQENKGIKYNISFQIFIWKWPFYYLIRLLTLLVVE
jgi:hypothetical protein